MDEGGRFFYYKDRDGRWWRRRGAWRCCEEVMFIGQCQGVLGHEGVHWGYSPSGDFCFGDPRGFDGQTPPGHPHYRNPEDMREFYYLDKVSEPFLVEDPDEIARLESGKLEDGECSVSAVGDE